MQLTEASFAQKSKRVFLRCRAPAGLVEVVVERVGVAGLGFGAALGVGAGAVDVAVAGAVEPPVVRPPPDAEPEPEAIWLTINWSPLWIPNDETGRSGTRVRGRGG